MRSIKALALPAAAALGLALAGCDADDDTPPVQYQGETVGMQKPYVGDERTAFGGAASAGGPTEDPGQIQAGGVATLGRLSPQQERLIGIGQQTQGRQRSTAEWRIPDPHSDAMTQGQETLAPGYQGEQTEAGRKRAPTFGRPRTEQ